ncbi:MAG: archaetidylserine decarboxylase [Thioalkalispiraceae bacterium]
MSDNAFIKRLTFTERLNFLLTNRIPRRYATLFIGWFSKLENPLVRKISLVVWQWFAGKIDLSEARKAEFNSLHDCFIRQLKPGSRTIAQNPETVISPCDGIIGASGQIDGTTLYQTKGFPYTLNDLLLDKALVDRYQGGHYITLRLTSTMYHRFHAPYDCHVTDINYISGDTWNVNPIALKLVEKLYCKNERAVIDLNLGIQDYYLTLVPVAAILVAGIKLHCLPAVLDLRYRGPNRLSCDASLQKGDEMGYFQHGSTIIVFANSNFDFAEGIYPGRLIKMGQPLLNFYNSPALSHK